MASSQKVAFRVGEKVKTKVKNLGINGEGVAYVNRQVLFIDGALPGEVIEAKVTKVSERHAQAEIVKILTESPDRIVPPCPVYAQCGGCSLQHMTYDAQLRMKRDLVIEAFSRYTKKKNLSIRPTLGMENPWQYRNKAQLPVGLINGEVTVGMYSSNSHQLVDTSDCAIQHPKTNSIVQTVRDIIKKLDIPLYDEKKNKGVIRHIVARVGFETEETQLTLVTRTKEIPHVKELLSELRSQIPYLTGIAQNVNPGKTSLVFGEETITLWGKAHIDEKLGDIDFSLSPRAFFQLNPEQTIKLYSTVKEAAKLTGKEIVVDAYCGVGTIGLWLAPHAKQIHGMDIVPEAISDAKRNAEKSGIKNTEFVVGAAEDILPQWLKKGFCPDVVVVDPPRTGLDRKLIEALIKVKPKRIVYVSCNPSTLAKDCDFLFKAGYEAGFIQPVDMFPQTPHVESVTELVLKKGR